MKGRKFSKKVSVIISFAAFLLVFAALLFVAYPLQKKYGNIGLVITELMMLVIAVLGGIVTGQKFSEMFPIKLPGLRSIFGAIIIWISMYIMSMAATAISGIFMPERFFAAGASLDGMSVAFKLFTVAFLAPVCEEAMHRGLITHFLKPIERKWIIILVIGVQFGLLHYEPVKFLSTGIAGACLAYVLLKSKNILLCVFIHFLTNLPASLVDSSSADFSEITAVSAEAGMPFDIVMDASMQRLSLLMTAGMFVLMCAAAPWLLYAGSVLLGNKGEPNPYNKKKLIACTVLSIAAAVVGFILFVVGLVMLVMSISSQIQI